jgi:large repetitive protein
MVNAQGTYALTVASGEITFVPTNDWNGITTLAYTVNDNEGNVSNIAYITITITSVMDAPTAMDDFATGFEDDPYISISMVQDNDVDPEGQGFIVGSIDIDTRHLLRRRNGYLDGRLRLWDHQFFSQSRL